MSRSTATHGRDAPCYGVPRDVLGLVCRAGSCLDEADCVQLTDRESSVCNVICSSNEPISFAKLRESTSLHQEIVSRTVRRLMIYGLVRKVDDGRYKGQCSQ